MMNPMSEYMLMKMAEQKLTDAYAEAARDGLARRASEVDRAPASRPRRAAFVGLAAGLSVVLLAMVTNR